MLSASLLLITLGLFAALIQAHLELTKLKQDLRRYGPIPSKEEFERKLDSKIHLKQNELSNLEGQQQVLQVQVDKLQQQLRRLDAKSYLQSLDSYESYYNFIYSEDYLIQLKNNKVEQELMRKSGRAYICHTQWTVGESKRDGEKMIKNLLELIKLAFENQCKFVLQEAKYNNVASLEKQIADTFEKTNKWSAVTHCEISREYLNLKIRELHLKCELEEKKQKEKEQQQEIRKQQREAEKEQRESEKARKEIEEFEEKKRKHQQELDRIRQEVRQAEGEKQKQLELRVQQLEQQVVKDEYDIEDATSRYRRAKAGHIYVVSNIGSFKRENVYRIFMTKSANEDDYVRGMNPLVPFPFDIHYKIYSEEPSDTIRYLHQRFQNKRVNLDNERRDFFQVPFDEIEQAVEEMRQEKEGIRICEFNPQPQNPEYFRSLSLERKRLQQ
jgi:hypothetical protein